MLLSLAHCHMYLTFHSVISGVGELNLNQKTQSESSPGPDDRPYPDCPYLLLDVRDREQYDCCHIIGGGCEASPSNVLFLKFPL